MPKALFFRRILGFLILAATAVILVFVVRFFIDNARKDRKNFSKPLSTDISMKTIHFTESQENLKKWELFAQSGIHDKSAAKTTLEQVRFNVERKGSNGPVTLTAKSGEYRHTPKIVKLVGDVQAKTADGMTFETAEITYYSPSRTFSTGEKVKLTDAALIVKGVGLNLIVDEQTAEIKSQVEATVYPGKGTK